MTWIGWLAQLVKYPGVPEMSVQDCYVVDYYDNQFHMNYDRAYSHSEQEVRI